jgi:hypothetical protein
MSSRRVNLPLSKSPTSFAMMVSMVVLGAEYSCRLRFGCHSRRPVT